MVTFICHYCDTTLKKKQVDGHIRGRCSPGAMICIDCGQTFHGQEHKKHISCITQQEKHWGQFAKTKKTKGIAKDDKGGHSKGNHLNNGHKAQNTSKKQQNQQTNKKVQKQQQKIQQQPIITNKKNKKQKSELKSEVGKQPKTQQHEPQAQNKQLWSGWKSQILQIINNSPQKIQKQQLMKKLRQVYKRKQKASMLLSSEQHLPELPKQQFTRIFEKKLSKVPGIKFQILTYCMLDHQKEEQLMQ